MSEEVWTYSAPGIVVLDGDFVNNPPAYLVNDKVTPLIQTDGGVSVEKYFIITKVEVVDGKTYLTLDGKGKYTLTDGAITFHRVSSWTTPTAGFPLQDPAYPLSSGKSGGQTIQGGTDSGDDLTLESTAHATKGEVYIQPSSGAVGIGISASPSAKLHILDNGMSFESLLDLVADNTDPWAFRILNKAYSTNIGDAIGVWQDQYRNFQFYTPSGGRFQFSQLIATAGDRIRIDATNTPATAGAAGTVGDICWDANYVYVCVATNTWKRAQLSSW